MATKPVRITTESEQIALSYGSTVSKGIREMEYRIKHPEAKDKLNAPIPFEKSYWDRWHIEMEKFVDKLKGDY